MSRDFPVTSLKLDDPDNPKVMPVVAVFASLFIYSVRRKAL